MALLMFADKRLSRYLKTLLAFEAVLKLGIVIYTDVVQESESNGFYLLSYAEMSFASSRGRAGCHGHNNLWC